MLRRQQIVLEQELVPALRQKQTLLVEQLIEQLPRHTNANGMRQVKPAELMAILAVKIQLHLEKVNLVIGVKWIVTAFTRFLAVASTANA
jgi:hypothetical protein